MIQQMKKPRPFFHSPIYIDDRRDRLAEIERRAREELGLDDSSAFESGSLHGAFSRGLRHVPQRKGSARGTFLSFSDKKGLGVPKLLMLIVLLMLIWKLLL